MAKIVLSLDGKIIDQKFLDQSRLTLGSGQEADLVVPCDSLQPLHAAFSTIVNDRFIESLVDGQTLMVNGKAITRHLLQHGDVVFLGDYRLKYLNANAAAHSLDRTQWLEPARVRDISATIADAPLNLDYACAAARAARDRLARGSVTGVWGRFAGTTVEIDRILLALGSPDECVAVINRRPTGCFLSHVSGKLRTKHNGTVLGNQAVLLKDGDTIDTGKEQVVFHTLGDSAPVSEDDQGDVREAA